MRKNGFTILELIVSIALITIVMLFMAELLADLQYSRQDYYIAKDNQEARVEMISNIEDTLYSTDNINKVIVKSGELDIYANNIITYKIIVNKSSLSFKSGDDKVIRSWGIDEKAEFDYANISCNEKDYSKNRRYEAVTEALSCTIYVHTDSIDNNVLNTYENKIVHNNNTLDDIIITFKYNKEKYQLRYE